MQGWKVGAGKTASALRNIPYIMKKLFAFLILCLAATFNAHAVQAGFALDVRYFNKPRYDDLPQIRKVSRNIRVLVPYSRTLFFVDKGHVRGITADTMRDFEKFVNRKFKTGRHPITVVLIPVTRDRMMTDLIAGRGDIAAGNLTITPEREAQAAFSVPVFENAREILALGPTAPPVASLDDLAGKRVSVKRSSSYYASLRDLGEKLALAGKERIDIQLLPEDLETEDVLDMVNAGILPMTVVDEHIGRLWKLAYEKLELRSDLVLREDAAIAYALRKDNPELKALVDEFVVSNRSGNRLLRNFEQYARRSLRIHNSRAGIEQQRFEQTIALFRAYGGKYGFNPLMLAAQGFQESNLDQEARSHVGAIGVMQLMPATGNSMRVGDIHKIEPNIHAGTKYMNLLMHKYFPKTEFDDQNRALFAFASYNAGPGRISRLRKEAEKEGLNPNIWFDNVELVVSRKVGIEPVQYVRNIYKYFVAYQLDQEGMHRQNKALDTLNTQ